MSARTIGIVLAATLFLASGAHAQQTRQSDVELQAAIRVETVQGDLRAAIKQYEALITRYSTDRGLVATALVRMAGCYQKLGDGESRKLYERVVREFADQAGPVAIARASLRDGGGSTRRLSRQVWTGPKVDSYGSVSADGRFISFTDWPSGNLSLHDLTTGRDRRLTDNKDGVGYEFAIGSVISPDSKRVAYGWVLVAPKIPAKDHFAEVRVVDVSGGKTTVLFRDRDVIGAYVHDWSDDGTWLVVVFSRRDHTKHLALLSTADGTMRGLKTLPTFGSETISRAAISPDGKYVAFDSIGSDDAGQRQIHVLPVDAPAGTTVLRQPLNDRVMGWSPDGRSLVFASERSGLPGIWIVFVTAGKPQGEPELIKPNVYARSLGITRSGALYYAVAASGPNISVAAAEFSTGKVISKPVALPAPYIGISDFPSWSPDGKSLAYLALKNSNSKSGFLTTVMIRSMETGKVHEVTPRLSYLLAPDKNRPIWARDGASIIVAGRDPESRFGIFSVDIQSGDTRPLVVSDAGLHDASAHALSQDGRTLYLKKHGVDGGQQLIVARDMVSGAERVLARAESFGDVVLSPDGRWLATTAFSGMARTTPPTSASASLLLVATDSAETRELLRAPEAEALGAFVAWLPDGKSLLFRKFARGSTRREPWQISIDGTGAREIDLGGILGLNPSIHPDGRQFAFVSNGDGPSLEVWALENFLPSAKTSR